jgi:ribosomal protein L37AE/L43A
LKATMKPSTPQVACPKCGRKQPKQGPNVLYWCDHCRMQHDDEPDEGGGFIDDPVRNAERKEEFQNRQQERRARR